MHNAAVSSDVIRRYLERHGGLRVFYSLISSHTAYIIVDPQNCFVAPGQVAEIAGAQEPAPRRSCPT